MDLDKTIEELDNLECAICDPCLQDVPVDVYAPNQLIEHVCIHHLFIMLPCIGLAHCHICERWITYIDGNMADVISHMLTYRCRDEARHMYGLPKTWHGGWTGWH